MPTLEMLPEEMEKRRRRRFEAENRKSRQDHPRASSIGQCAREIFHQINDTHRKPEYKPELLQRFRRGSEIERLVVRELLEDDWDATSQQDPFEIIEEIDVPYADGTRRENVVIVTGHIDGRIDIGSARPVYEVKSLHPNIWAKINSATDFFKLDGFWHRYPVQLLLYMHANDEEMGMFVLDDCLGHRKVLPLWLKDCKDELESALDRCRRAKIASLIGIAPAYHTDPGVCSNCWARGAGVCTPAFDFAEQGYKVMVDSDVATNLARMDELKEARDEYERLDRSFTKGIKSAGDGKYLFGDYTVTCTTVPRKKYEVPDDVRDQYLVVGTMTKIKWENVAPPVAKKEGD